MEHENSIEVFVSANEGNAIAEATGYYLATGKVQAVYMQNSGLGNAVNPMLSLVHEQVCNIPTLMIIGWRGFPGEHDEPQHVVQGKVTEDLLRLMNVRYGVIKGEEALDIKVIEEAGKTIEAGVNLQFLSRRVQSDIGAQ